MLVLFLVAAAALASCSKAEKDNKGFPQNLKEALNVIDEEIGNKPNLIAKHEVYIDSLKEELSCTPISDKENRFALYDKLVRAYSHFNLDSLLYYADVASDYAKAMGSPVMWEHFQINKIHAVPLMGKTYETVSMIDTVNVNNIYPENQIEFMKESWQAAISVLSMCSSKGINYEYLARFVAVNRQMEAMLPETDPFYPVVKSVVQYGDGDYTLAVATATAATEKMDMDDEYYVDLVRVMSLYEYSRNNMEQWRYMLALASIMEIRSLRLDGESLRQLCGSLVHIGEIERSHHYLLESQNDNARSGAVMRGVHMFDMVPIISENYHSRERTHSLLLYGVIGLLFVLLAFCGAAFRVHLRHRDKLLSMHDNLERANDRKEGNLGHFIALCTSYMERMEDFNRIVVRKLGAGQVSELHSLAKSGKYVDEQRRMFYDVFDEAFVNMYPTFIDDVNRLCLPDKKVKPGENGKLTPELRILAFMRLGTDDGAQIARLLGLSLNTIYTYRNRAKNRAINRNTFESDVMNIGRVG